MSLTGFLFVWESCVFASVCWVRVGTIGFERATTRSYIIWVESIVGSSSHHTYCTSHRPFSLCQVFFFDNFCSALFRKSGCLEVRVYCGNQYQRHQGCLCGRGPFICFVRWGWRTSLSLPVVWWRCHLSALWRGPWWFVVAEHFRWSQSLQCKEQTLLGIRNTHKSRGPN